LVDLRRHDAKDPKGEGKKQEKGKQKGLKTDIDK